MLYSKQQIVSKRKFFLSFGSTLFIIWFSLLLPIMVPSLFLVWLPCVALLILFDFLDDPIERRLPHEVFFTIHWPKFLELHKSHEIEIHWNITDPEIYLKVFFPLDFSPRVFSIRKDQKYFRVRGKKKGTFKEVEIYLCLHSRSGLFKFHYPIYHQREITVISPILYLSKKIQLPGMQKENMISKLMGGESEFHSLRLYQTGDYFKHINWRKSMSSNKDIFINVYEKEQNREVMIILNTGMASRFEYRGFSYLDYQIALCFQLSLTFLRNNDSTGLLTFSNKVDQFLPPYMSKTQSALIFQYLSESKESYTSMDLTDMFSFLKNKLAQKAILIILSPFLSYQQLYVQKKILTYMSARFDIIWLNPLRSFMLLKDKKKKKNFHQEAVDMWYKAHILKDSLQQEKFFRSTRMRLVHEPPEKLYEKTLTHYYSLKW